MCLQNMENSPKHIDKNILDLFWKLTDKNPTRRANICLDIIRSLQVKHNQGLNDGEISKDLKYCIERLVKGLASSRDAARLGYTLLLTQILKQFSVIEVEDVLELIKQHLSFTPKQEKRDIVFGQLFAYSSVVRSGKLANHSHLSFVFLSVFDLWQGRNYIINACYEMMKNLFIQLTTETFSKELWPHIKKKYSDGWEKCSSDTLWLLLLCLRCFPDAISEKFLKKHFNAADILSNENFDNLKRVIRQTTSCLPKVHPLCSEISLLCKSRKDMKEIWLSLVDDNLFEGDLTEKSFVGFEMVKCILQEGERKKVVKYVLSPKFRSLFARSYINLKSPMNPASTQLAAYLSKYAIKTTDPDIQMLVLKFFLQPPGTMSLDQILKKKEVSSLIQNLLPEAVKVYCEFLKNIILKNSSNGEDEEENISDNRRFVAIAQIGSLMSHAKIMTDIEWRINVIKFLFLHSFFSIKEVTSEILHCEQNLGEVPDSLRESFKDAFFKTLTSLYQRIDQQTTPLQHSLQCLLILVDFTDQLMTAGENLKPLFHLEKVQESWLQMKNIVHKLQKQSKKDGKVNESNAFLALFLELGFHLFHDAEYTVEILEELHICCKKALSERKHANQLTDDANEPPWVGVVTDIMLSLLSKPSHHLRRLVTAVFQLLCPFITKEALHQILAVISPEKSSEDAMLVDESDDEGSMNFDSGSSSDDSDANEPDDFQVDLQFKKKIKEALGSAADTSDAESIVLSDSEMFKLDDVLSKAFRERVQTGHTQMSSEDKAMLDFRTRCLDLIIAYLKSEPPMYLVLECIEPILAAYEFSHRNEQQNHLLHKIVSTIDTITKIKKFQNYENVSKSDLKKLLEILIEKSHKEINMNVAKKLYSLCVFIVLCFKRLESHKSPEKKMTKYPSYIKMYLSALEAFAKGSSHIFPQFFVSLMESCQDTAWELIGPCKNYAFNRDVRMYKRTQCLGLLFEAIKFAKGQKQISTEDWCELIKSLIPLAIETLKISLQESDIKPVYLTELLDVIYANHLISVDKMHSSILTQYTELVPLLCNLPKQEEKRLSKKGKNLRKKIVLSLGGKIEPKVKKQDKDDSQPSDISLKEELSNSLKHDSSTKKRKPPSSEKKKKKLKSEIPDLTNSC